jgi:uncharacterized membrane protein
MSSNALLWRISILLIVGAIVSITAFSLISSYVDEQGFLHEPFILLPLFWLLSLGSVITAVLALIVRRGR